ncbi:formin-like protein 4 [Cucurbita moschata]|uniref:Formin-like protein n=1 Tax=Cucurbita moschata TaxID=3662 RepID=A0A6J1FPF1_CUCMO|nr:formin-like protein 4 [Cucurbita moschata]
MAMLLHLRRQPWPLHLLLLFLSVSPVSYCQDTPPQNIETFYPILPPPPFLPVHPPSPSPSSSPSSSTRTIVTAVAITAVGMALISTVFFFLIQRYLIRRKRKTEEVNSGPGQGPVSQPAVARSEFARVDGNLKGFIVDEDGLDVIYWKRLERRKSKNSFDRGDGEGNVQANRSKKSEPVQEIPLLRGKSSSSHVKISPEDEEPRRVTPPPPPPPSHINNPPPFTGKSVQEVGKPSSSSILSSPAPPQPAAIPVPPSQSLMAVPNNKSSVPPPPPPIPAKTVSRPPPPPPPIATKTNSRPPPPPPIPAKTNSAAPPPPPIVAKANPAAPPPPKAGSSKLPLRPAPQKEGKSSGESSTSADNGQVKMKPLHWDKVNTANADHSMVWDKMQAGSFKFDGDLMEALFGYVATNRKSPRSEANSSAIPTGRNSGPSQTFILEPKKSQNIAIVVKSLTIPRNEILDALNEGQGLETDVLEKLTRITLTQEEISQILAYKGDPQKLADAETFLYPLLKAVPSAFARFNAMLFRLTFGSDIHHLKESLEILESACKELRTRGLFLKLLEAVLKAGNRLNAGTARGNARAFNLSALRKLSDVRSTDGKTTLLHFVVQEVIRAEGKRCVLNRNKSLSRNTSHASDSSVSTSDNSSSKEDRVNEYMMLGLPVVGGLSAEFSNVKKAATIDYESFANTGTSLTNRTAEIRQLMAQIGNNGGGFGKEMRGFLEAAESELKVVREEQTKVMELVMKTTEYYQAGSSRDKESNRLQFFIIVKDFLEMVDRVCVEISRNLQKRRSSTVNVGSSPVRSKAIFPNLPPNFMSDKSRGSSSDSDNEF